MTNKNLRTADGRPLDSVPSQKTKVKTSTTSPIVGRFAPSPTGRLHLGNAFASLAAWLAARYEGEQSGDGSRMILRIEDIDVPRTVPDADRWIMEDLAWLGLDWDGDVTYQSQRLELYRSVLNDLALFHVDEETQAVSSTEWLTYPCTCTRAQLRAASAPQESDGFVVYPGTCRFRANASDNPRSVSTDFLPHDLALAGSQRKAAVRLAVPQATAPKATVSFNDLIFGEQSWNLAGEVGDVVLRRSDGLYAYQLAVTVDDYVQGVNQIVRGRDLLRSTAVQIYLRTHIAQTHTVQEQGSRKGVLGKTSEKSEIPTPRDPEYAHLPLLLSKQRLRLAKRDHSLELASLRDSGVPPQAVIGYLSWLMGLIPEPALLTPQEALGEFSWKKIRTAGFEDRVTDPSILTGRSVRPEI